MFFHILIVNFSILFNFLDCCSTCLFIVLHQNTRTNSASAPTVYVGFENCWIASFFYKHVSHPNNFKDALNT